MIEEGDRESVDQPRLLALIVEAAGLAPADRRAWFEQRLGSSNPDRVNQVLELAALVEEATCVEASPALDSNSAHLPSIAGFELRELIGHGGMGSVFRARQKHPEREVAVKLIRADLMSDSTRARLVREANLLARLDHPAIARVFAAGEASQDNGCSQPWLAMELIEEDDLRGWMGQLRPDNTTLLSMFERLARAIQYAHQKGVIHCDLKPSNILIDGEDQPHILDFGIARLTDLGASQASIVARQGELVGTLGYMAPEQLDGQVDTRSDVYALGVMLYQALSGVMPIELTERSLLDALGRVAREEPRPLGRVSPDIDPELEALVMHALARDPAERYASAGELADDLDRYLNHRPLVARPPGMWRSTFLFARRHRLAVAAAGLVVLSLLIGVVTTVYFGLREAQARAVAETRAAQLQAVNRFIGDMLIAADPDNALGERVSVVDTLDEAARMLQFDRELDAPVRAELQTLIGRTLVNLGRADEGSEHLEQALEIMAHADNTVEEDSWMARLYLARARLDRGQIDAALELARSVESQVSDVDPGRLIRIHSAAHLGRALLEAGREEEAEILVIDRLAEGRANLGEDHPDVLVLANLLASIFGRQGDFAREIEMQRDIVEKRRQFFGQNHPQTLSALNNLAKAQADAGQLEPAEMLLRETLQRRVRVLGPDHPYTVITRSNLAALLIRSGHPGQAESMAREVMQWNLANLGPHHPNTLTARNILAFLLEDLDQHDEAEAMYREILSELERAGDDGLRAQLLAVGNNLAMLLLERGRLDAAEAEFIRLLELSERLLGVEHFNHQVFLANYGWCLHHMGRSAEAVNVMTASLAGLVPILGQEHPRIIQITERLALARKEMH